MTRLARAATASSCPSSSTFARARPLEPMPFTKLLELVEPRRARASRCSAGIAHRLHDLGREIAAVRAARELRRRCPCRTGRRRRRARSTSSVRSMCCMPKRRSGLSLPYFAIDSVERAAAGSARSGTARAGRCRATSFQTVKIRPSIDAEDVVLVHERHLDVDLRELGLAIDAQVLVAEALHDLEVAVEAGHHEELLEELRALGERVELARRSCGAGRGSCARRRACTSP